MFTGRIQGRGPRYCPSIEDKIDRFADKDHHQLFVEPEGWHSQSYYLNGFSSSLPLEVQLEALHSIEGFEQARIFKPGYAIEYDYCPPTQLVYTLETKRVENLYFAGQMNGTTGYEEAACQGLDGGHQCRVEASGQGTVHPRTFPSVYWCAHRRPCHQRCRRAVPYVHLAGRIPYPPCGRTMPTSASRRCRMP